MTTTINSTLTKDLPFIAGGGEMGELTRSIDWALSPLGTPDKWPMSLKTTVGIVLHSAFPMFLFWGPELICFYNDAFMPSLGVDGKHPAVGKTGEEVWGDIWPQIWPWMSQVIKTGQPVFFEDQLVPFYRNGRKEDIYWTFSYSPAYGDDGAINGVFVTCFETTQKVNTLAKLEASKRQFQNLVRESTVGIVVLMGQEKRVEIVNEAYGRLIERTVEDLQGKCLWDVIPEAAAEFDILLEKVRLTGEPVYLYDHPYLVHAGEKKIEGFLNVIYQPYREEDGTITGIMAICQDVTSQVRNTVRLQENEQKVRALVEAAPFPIGVYTGKEMRIELANQSIMDAWGKGYDVIGKNYPDILPELSNQKIFDQLDLVYTTGKPFAARGQRVDLVVDDKLRPFYFNYNFSPLYNGEGKVYGVMNTAADVTDLHLAMQKVKQSEMNLRNMVIQAPVAMCILLGPDHVIEVANDMMIELWGKDRDTVMNKPVFEAVPDAREQGLELVMKNVYDLGEAFHANEHPVKLFRKGKWDTVYQNFVYEPYKDSDGNILGVLAISVDVTPQVLARQKIEEVVAQRTAELAEVNTSLHRSNEELAQFAYIASHDLQEPIRKVSTFVQLLQRDIAEKGGRSAHYIEKIEKASERMLILIRDVLAYSQLSQLQSGFTGVDLQEVMSDVVNDFELIIEEKGAVISYQNLPTVSAIPLQMAQLFGNLVSNALKFSTTDQAPVITITSAPLSNEELMRIPELNSDGKYHHIIVKDNGIGFSPEHADKIFNIFQRLHEKKSFEGTGIGLATCKKIVQNHRGHIYAESAKGEGASFHIILPV